MKKAITRERNEISSPKLRLHMCKSSIFGQIKQNYAALLLGGAIMMEKTYKQL